MVFPSKINTTTTTTQNQNQNLEEKIEEGQKVITEASSRSSTTKALQPALRCSASEGGRGGREGTVSRWTGAHRTKSQIPCVFFPYLCHPNTSYLMSRKVGAHGFLVRPDCGDGGGDDSGRTDRPQTVLRCLGSGRKLSSHSHTLLAVG